MVRPRDEEKCDDGFVETSDVVDPAADRSWLSMRSPGACLDSGQDAIRRRLPRGDRPADRRQVAGRTIASGHADPAAARSWRAIQCIDSGQLPHTNQAVRLVSASSSETSDLFHMNLVKQQNVDFLLTGEVIEQPSEQRSRLHRQSQYGDELVPLEPLDPTASAASAVPTGAPGDPAAVAPTESTPVQVTQKTIAVSWKLVDLRNGGESKGFPIVTRYDSTLDKQAAAKLAANDAWNLLAPSIFADQAKLTAPYLAPGSREVRQGNEAAMNGDWMTAQSRWQQAIQRHPRNHAAAHNLAVAAVAQQDFDAANQWIGQAIRRSPNSRYRSTAVWIEAKQRDYHDSFGLPDPPGGWSAVRR